MKPWLETLRLPQPLRSLRPAPPAALAPDEAELRQLEHAAYDRGRRDGERALSEQLLQQRAELIELQNGVLAALQNALPGVIRECEAALVELALEAARKLVAGLPVSAEMVEAVVREALAQAEAGGELEVQLHPEDLATLRRVNSPLLVAHQPDGRLRLVESPEVSRGGCLVQTRFGVIDGRRETKLALLKQTLQS